MAEAQTAPAYIDEKGHRPVGVERQLRLLHPAAEAAPIGDKKESLAAFVAGLTAGGPCFACGSALVAGESPELLRCPVCGSVAERPAA